jgi:hypothetical protein
MSSARLSVESLQNFKEILSVYRNDTNKNKWLSGETGKKRLETVNHMLLAFESAGEINRQAFLTEMAAFAYTAYKASWTKASDSLSAQMLTFVAKELKMKKYARQPLAGVPYAARAYMSLLESDKDFFKRVHEAVNPTPAVVKKFVESEAVTVRAGYPVTEQQKAAAARKHAEGRKQHVEQQAHNPPYPRSGSVIPCKSRF